MAGGFPDTNGNLVPDECEDCNGNGVPDDLDIAAGTSVDCDGNALPDECDLAVGNDTDSNANGVLDQCDHCILTETASIVHSISYASFGGGAAMSGTTALVSAAWERSDGVNEAGAAYIIERDGDTWIETARLTAPEALRGELFGLSVALDGDVAVVGAPRYRVGDGLPGVAYVFRREGSTWTRESTLTADDDTTTNHFGVEVAVSGNTIAIGANAADEAGENAGAVYLYEYADGAWGFQAKLLPPAASDGAFFGEELAMADDWLVIGASGANEDVGLVYLYQRVAGAWTLVQVLEPGGTATSFGATLALKGDQLAIGAPGNGVNVGSVSIYERLADTWVQTAEVPEPDHQTGSRFGNSIAISGDHLIVGAFYSSYSAAGAAWVFQRDIDDWDVVGRLAYVDYHANSYFGTGIVISGKWVGVGATGVATGGTQGRRDVLLRRAGRLQRQWAAGRM